MILCYLATFLEMLHKMIIIRLKTLKEEMHLLSCRVLEKATQKIQIRMLWDTGSKIQGQCSSVQSRKRDQEKNNNEELTFKK